MMKETHWKVLKGNAIKNPGTIERYMEEHSRILDAIEKGESEKVRKEMFNHIKLIQNDVF